MNNIMMGKTSNQSKFSGYLSLMFIGIISPFLFLAFCIILGLLLTIILLPFNIEISTPWFYLLSCLFLLLIASVVYVRAKDSMQVKCIFGMVPVVIFMLSYVVASGFAVEKVGSWSGCQIFSINPLELSTTTNFNVPILFVPATAGYSLSVMVVVATILLSLFVMARKFDTTYLLTSISALLFMMGIILFFDFISPIGGPNIVGSYLPLLLSSVLAFNYFSFKKFPENLLVRSFSIFVLLLSFGIIQDNGYGHLPLLWAPIDFDCWCACGGGCHAGLVIFWGFFAYPLPLGCLEAYILSGVSVIVYWVLLSRLIIFAYDKFGD